LRVTLILLVSTAKRTLLNVDTLLASRTSDGTCGHNLRPRVAMTGAWNWSPAPHGNDGRWPRLV
jgi:hypothetical protein